MRGTRTVGVLASVLLLSATLSGTAGAAPGATPGSAGLGDPVFPTYGNGGYRVAHYDVADAYEPATGRLTGSTTVRARTTQALSAFDLDFVLHTTSVTVNGRPAAFRQYRVDRPAGVSGGELVVTPDRPLPRGAAMTVVVRYSDVPADVTIGGWNGSVRTATGAILLGEPVAATWWYPCNDHPGDKASFDVSLRVPEGLTGVSNGHLVDHRTAGGRTTWHWRQPEPIPTYASFAAFGEYDLVNRPGPGGVRMAYAFATHPGAPEEPRARRDMLGTDDVIEWTARQWGAYPFGVAGGVLPDSPYLGLETATKPVIGPGLWGQQHPYPEWNVVVHENAHQWFGDSVTPANWSYIWLSEGFATFDEWWYSERRGLGTAAAAFARTYARYPADDPFWTPTIGAVTDPATWPTTAAYYRGAMTLQALRTRVGDRAFVRLMRDWVARHRGGTVSTADFVALAGHDTGQDLAGFFRAWLFTPGKPAPTPANGVPTP